MARGSGDPRPGRATPGRVGVHEDYDAGSQQAALPKDIRGRSQNPAGPALDLPPAHRNSLFPDPPSRAPVSTQLPSTPARAFGRPVGLPNAARRPWVHFLSLDEAPKIATAPW